MSTHHCYCHGPTKSKVRGGSQGGLSLKLFRSCCQDRPDIWPVTKILSNNSFTGCSIVLLMLLECSRVIFAWWVAREISERCYMAAGLSYVTASWESWSVLVSETHLKHKDGLLNSYFNAFSWTNVLKSRTIHVLTKNWWHVDTEPRMFFAVEVGWIIIGASIPSTGRMEDRSILANHTKCKVSKLHKEMTHIRLPISHGQRGHLISKVPVKRQYWYEISR